MLSQKNCSGIVQKINIFIFLNSIIIIIKIVYDQSNAVAKKLQWHCTKN